MMNSTKFLLTLLLGLALGGGCATSNDPSLPTGQAAAVQTGERTEAEVIPATEQRSAPATYSSTAQATPVAVTRESAAAPVDQVGRGNGDYQLGPEDLLDIQVFGVSDLSRTVRVSSRGSISLPLIGEVKVAGLTSSALEDRLAELLAKDYLQHPQVTVFIKEYTSQRVTVGGTVNKAGVYPLKGQTTLLQAIAMAEGLNDKLDPSNQVTLFRNLSSGGKQTLEFNLTEIRNGSKPDPIVQNNDIILVGQNRTTYMIKEIANTIRGFILPFPVFQ